MSCHLSVAADGNGPLLVYRLSGFAVLSNQSLVGPNCSYPQIQLKLMLEKTSQSNISTRLWMFSTHWEEYILLIPWSRSAQTCHHGAGTVHIKKDFLTILALKLSLIWARDDIRIVGSTIIFCERETQHSLCFKLLHGILINIPVWIATVQRPKKAFASLSFVISS